MKKVLVTGCAGFVGSHLTEALLKKGVNVIGIDNFDPYYSKSQKLLNLGEFKDHSAFSFFELDIRKISDLDAITVNDVDLVVHLAAKAGIRTSIANPAEYIETNITGTQNVLDWMKKNNCKKMIFASSSSIYGNNKKVPFSESDNVDFPISPYASTKKACELINYTYHHLYDFDILNLRFFTLFGPRQRPDLAIHKFIKKMLKSETIELYGDGTTARDYVYIADLIDGILKSIDFISSNNGVYEIINLGNSSPVSLIDLIATLSKELNVKPEIRYVEKQAGDVDITFADISKAKKILGYDPKTKISVGIAEFVNWYKKYHTIIGE